MSEAQGVLLFSALMFGGFVLFGLITDTMVFLNGFRVSRYDRPKTFWFLTAVNAGMTVFMLILAATAR